MEEKISKLFSFFEDSKNEKIFDLCITQISEIYNQNPNSLQFILEKNLKLLNSKVWNQRVIGSTILEKCLNNYNKKMELFLTELIFDENSINQYSHLFILEKTTISSQIEIKSTINDKNSLDYLKYQDNITPDSIDFKYLLKNEKPLYAYDEKLYQKLKKTGIEDENKILEKLCLGSNFDLKNMSLLLEEIPPISENKEEEDYNNNNNNNNSSKKTKRKGKDNQESSKKHLKSKKIKLNDSEKLFENKEEFEKISDSIPNMNTILKINIIFNKIYEKYKMNLFHMNWEIRHSACLVLKAFINNQFQFLGFQTEFKFDQIEKEEKQKILLEIQNQLKDFQKENNQNYFKKSIDTLTRILIIVALDRFGDFLFEKFYLVVRETACQNFGLIISKDNMLISNEIIQNIFPILEIFLNSSEWQVIQSALYLIKIIIESRSELSNKILEYFQKKFISLFENNDEIILLLSEIMILYSKKEGFFNENSSFVSEIFEISWTSIGKQDEISYSTATILEMIISFNELGVNSTNDFDFYLLKLLRLFHHNLKSVRKSTYKLVEFILNRNILILKKLKNYETIKKIAILSSQNLLIEENKEEIDILLNINSNLLLFLYNSDKKFVGNLLGKILKNSVNVSTQSIVKQFEFFDNFVEENPYTTISFPEKNKEQIELCFNRIFSVTKLFSLFYSGLKEINFINSLFQENNKDNINNTFYILLKYCIICELNQKFEVDKLESLESIEQNLQIEVHSLERSDLREIENNIANELKSLAMLLKKNNQSNINEFLDFLNNVSNMENKTKRKNLENIYNKILSLQNYFESKESNEKSINTVNCIKSILILINNHVTSTMEIQNTLKSSAAYLYCSIFYKNKQIPSKLNLIIRPLLSYLNDEKYLFFSEKNAQTFFKLALLFEGKNPSPLPKIIQNLFSSVIETPKINLYLKNYYENIDKKIDFTHLYSKKGDCIIKFMNLLIEHYKEKIFVVFPDILESVLKEINLVIINDNLSDLSASISYKEILKNLIGLKIIIKVFLNEKILKNLSIIFDKLIDLFLFLNYVDKNILFINCEDKLIDRIIDKAIKICFIILTNLNNKTYLLNFVAEIYKLLKNSNTLAFNLISKLYSEYYESFFKLAPIFIIRILKSLNHNDKKIKDLSSQSLSNLINSTILQYNPKIIEEELSNEELNGNLIPDYPILPESIRNAYKKGKTFILDFQNSKNFNYNLKGKLNVELRPYQLEGIKWLAFLVKYHLHGALCDDMGLGKTVQTLTVLQSEIIKSNKKEELSIIICPSTLTEHWLYEIKKYFDPDFMKPLIYKPNTIKNKNEIIGKFNILLVSFNHLQKILDIFGDVLFKFCIVDEAHVIKNSKTKVSKNIKSFRAEHRLVLTGTPIQNNILELWSIFDFLMPEYLGNEEYFKKYFSKMLNINILTFSDKSLIFSKEQDKILADLHKKITPFILRREKSEVLKELPQKIIQDYYCTMTDMQNQLYNELENNQIKNCNDILEIEQEGQGEIKETSKSVLEIMILMRKICNHPFLLYKENNLKNSNFANIFNRYQFDKLNDFENSGKFLALKDLFNEFGFEESNNGNEESIDSHLSVLSTINKNKILIFSRFKETLDLIASQFVDKLFPQIRYLRLDGSVPNEKRFGITKIFNEDIEYKILLLTTGVGGVGLNLSSANIVIMFDHDYNPMNDLQAIDRAHRIGQKNILNVYRLIMKDTLEEKIMGIQKFKLNVANTVINIENSSIKNVKDSNILNLFENAITKNSDKKEDKNKKNENKFNPYAKVIENLQELWNEEEYKN